MGPVFSASARRGAGVWGGELARNTSTVEDDVDAPDATAVVEFGDFADRFGIGRREL